MRVKYRRRTWQNPSPLPQALLENQHLLQEIVSC